MFVICHSVAIEVLWLKVNEMQDEDDALLLILVNIMYKVHFPFLPCRAILNISQYNIFFSSFFSPTDLATREWSQQAFVIRGGPSSDEKETPPKLLVPTNVLSQLVYIIFNWRPNKKWKFFMGKNLSKFPDFEININICVMWINSFYACVYFWSNFIYILLTNSFILETWS